MEVYAVIDSHREMAVSLKNDDGVSLVLRVRASVDGVSWSIPGNFETYELDTRELPISSVETANTPFTFHAGDVWGSIHEAALYDFPEMNLYRCDSLVFRTELAPGPDGVKARIPGKFTTPWRTVQIGRKAVDLINSSLILNLNEPCAIEDVSWIKPQKYVGVWWGMHLGTQTWVCDGRHGATTENALKHIDFAEANNIDGVLFEGWNQGWESWGGRQHFDYCKPYPDFEKSAWQSCKIGAGPVPIGTSEGWLMFYHGVHRTCLMSASRARLFMIQPADALQSTTGVPIR